MAKKRKPMLRNRWACDECKTMFNHGYELMDHQMMTRHKGILKFQLPSLAA